MSLDTTEKTADEAEQPVPWIVQYQRVQCDGASPLTTFQGMLSDEIVLPQSAADHPDPEQLVLATDAWADALMNQAFFLPGEFAQEALMSYYARDYLVQARAGGHAQYYANRSNDEIAIKAAAAGLKSMLADLHLDLFNLMMRLQRARPADARKIAADKGYRSAKAALKDLDKKFAEVEAQEPLTPRHRTWLKSLRKLKIVPDAEMNGHLQRVAKANRLIARRKMEADRVRAERLRAEPSFRAVKALCDAAGLTITGLRNIGVAPAHSAWPEGPNLNAHIFRADTDKGPRAALFYRQGALFKRYVSVLVEQGGSVPAASLALTKADYEDIVQKGG